MSDKCGKVWNKEFLVNCKISPSRTEDNHKKVSLRTTDNAKEIQTYIQEARF